MLMRDSCTRMSPWFMNMREPNDIRSIQDGIARIVRLVQAIKCFDKSNFDAEIFV